MPKGIFAYQKSQFGCMYDTLIIFSALVAIHNLSKNRQLF
jgi:hypothetical protein